jgi:hypothetical protein
MARRGVAGEAGVEARDMMTVLFRFSKTSADDNARFDETKSFGKHYAIRYASPY